MNLATLATILVSLAFAGLCLWVLWPGNRKRFESYGRIPFDAADEIGPESKRLEQPIPAPPPADLSVVHDD